MTVEITCINKDGGNHQNPYEAIERFGWYNPNNHQMGFVSLSGMIKFLEDPYNQAYVVNLYDSTDKAYLVVRERNGRKFVQTVADGQWSDNLLSLSECKN